MLDKLRKVTYLDAMSDEQILKDIKKLIDAAGEARVLSALTGKGIGSATAFRIVSGSYSNRPSRLLRRALVEILTEQAS